MVYCNWCVWYCGYCSFSKGKKTNNLMENISVSVFWRKWDKENQTYRPFRKHSLHHWRVSVSVSHCSAEDEDRLSHRYFEVTFSLRRWTTSRISVTAIQRDISVLTACNDFVRKISLMKQQFVLTHRHKRLQQID